MLETTCWRRHVEDDMLETTCWRRHVGDDVLETTCWLRLYTTLEDVGRRKTVGLTFEII